MFLYRLVGRDRLRKDEVRPYPQNDIGADLARAQGPTTGGEDCRGIEFESLDVIEFGPYFLLLAAQEKGQEIIAQAKAEAKQVRNEAARQGAAQGQEEAKQEILPSLVAFANAGQTLIVFEERLISRYTPELVRLALDIAEKIIHKTVKEDPEIVALTLERAKEEIADAKQIRIWLNPKDFQLLGEMRPDLVKLGDDKGRRIELAPAEDIGRGGCRLETEMGVVDATVPTQIDEVRRQLLDEEFPRLNRGSSSPRFE